MANRERGELRLEIGGVPYTFVIDINMICEVESMFGLTYLEISERIRKGSVTHLRGFVWQGLQRHHKGITIEQVGDLIFAVGSIEAFSNVLMHAATESTPDPADLRALGVKPDDPPLAQAGASADGPRPGTSTRSTGRRVPSA